MDEEDSTDAGKVLEEEKVEETEEEETEEVWEAGSVMVLPSSPFPFSPFSFFTALI